MDGPPRLWNAPPPNAIYDSSTGMRYYLSSDVILDLIEILNTDKNSHDIDWLSQEKLDVFHNHLLHYRKIHFPHLHGEA